MSVQLLVILVPVLLGFTGFAIDLGRLYLIRGQLNQAANAMALAAAAQLASGTGSAAANVAAAGDQALSQAAANINSYGAAIAPAGTVACYATLADASANNTGASVDCGTAQDNGSPVFVQASLSTPAPLLFWGLLPGGQARSTPVASYAVAGVSAPLCTGCGIVPFGVLAPDASLADQTNWGFVPNALYTFYYSCSGTAPAALAGTAVPYVILNRIDPSLDESDQLFRQGAQGIQGSTAATPNACTTSTTPAPLACVNVGDIEQIPTTGNATLGACTGTVSAPLDVTWALCGMESRLDTSYPGNCGTSGTPVTDFDALSAASQPDTDPAYYSDIAAYNGNGRRIITLAIVNVMPTDATCNSGMTVLGFRQFLVNEPADGSTFNPTDTNGRFVALYMGNASPIPAGWFDTRYAPSCRSYLTTGPGKVVLHQ